MNYKKNLKVIGQYLVPTIQKKNNMERRNNNNKSTRVIIRGVLYNTMNGSSWYMPIIKTKIGTWKVLWRGQILEISEYDLLSNTYGTFLKSNKRKDT